MIKLYLNKYIIVSHKSVWDTERSRDLGMLHPGWSPSENRSADGVYESTGLFCSLWQLNKAARLLFKEAHGTF